MLIYNFEVFQQQVVEISKVTCWPGGVLGSIFFPVSVDLYHSVKLSLIYVCDVFYLFSDVLCLFNVLPTSL